MPDNSPIDQMLDAALAQHEAGHLDLAENGYRTVLQHDPDEPDALNLLGVILQERGELDQSIALLTHALDITPDFPEALANLARAQCAAGSPAAAAAAARRAITLEPAMVEAHLQLGRALSDLGEHANAVETLRQAAAFAPQSADIMRQLGVALLRLNDPQTAVESLTAALKLDPEDITIKASLALALTGLTRVHLSAGNATGAVMAARRAVELDPILTDAQILLDLAKLVMEATPEAVVALYRATEMNPDSLEAHVALGAVLARRKEHAAAAEAWEAALRLKPDAPDLLLKYAAALGDIERYDDAMAVFRRADALAPGEPRIAFCIALCLLRMGDNAAAAELCRNTVETAPDWPELWMLLANAEAGLGHFEAAARGFRRTLELVPNSPDALHDLASVSEGPGSDAARDVLRQMLNDEVRSTDDRIFAGFTLGRLNDRDGAFDDAFAAYVTANQLLRGRRAAARGYTYDRAGLRRFVDRMTVAIGPQTFADTAGWGDPSDQPVFVVGMPRSGTSLVEQIAASHPAVFGAGERKEVPRIVTLLAGDGMFGPPPAWDREATQREAAAYAQYLRSLDSDAKRAIDKQPNNILCLGQIAVLFPQARIVVCNRDLRDTCLSCFFQFFQDDNVAWADDLDDCAFRAREIDRLMRHWRKVLPIPVLDIQYEDLVGNLEAESRRLIDFLGLNWDPACLAFHETERAVQTASRWQVRQPLYASSVGRWRHYRRHLPSLFAGLAGLVPDDGDDDVSALPIDPAQGYQAGLSPVAST